MNNNRKGFTLIEMLVCIGIIAALSIAVGVGANKIIENSQHNHYEEIMTELFNNAMIYSELSKGHCNFSSSNKCDITLDNLVSLGLIDKDYYNEANPLYESQKFLANDIIVVTKSNGVKDAEYNCGSYTVKLSEVKDYKDWGKC